MTEPPPYPGYGEPCNGCGQCCQESLCPLATLVFRDSPAPCPALEWAPDPEHGGRFRCGLIDRPAAYAPVRTRVHGVAAMREAAVRFTGAGAGCDARQPGDPIPPHMLQRLAQAALQDNNERERLLRRWVPA